MGWWKLASGVPYFALDDNVPESATAIDEPIEAGEDLAAVGTEVPGEHLGPEPLEVPDAPGAPFATGGIVPKDAAVTVGEDLVGAPVVHGDDGTDPRDAEVE